MREGSALRAIVFVAALTGPVATAFAQEGQEEPGSIYAIAGIQLTHQPGPSGEAYQTYVAAPGGRTVGWIVGGGVFIASVVSVEAELSATGWMTAREQSRYDTIFIEERRDRSLSLAIRFYLREAKLLRIEPVVGLVFTNPEAWGHSQSYSNPALKGMRTRTPLDTQRGMAFGADVRIGGRHIALLPSFRMLWTGEGGEYREILRIYPGGYPEWTTRAGVAIRADF